MSSKIDAPPAIGSAMRSTESTPQAEPHEASSGARLMPRSFGVALLAILAVAVAVRAPGLGEWSLWEDEETSLHYSQRPEKPFPSSFPIFFRTLQGVYAVTGVDIFAGRVFCAFVGVVTVVLTFLCFGRLWSRQVGFLTALFVALSLGHLFWSQSIRYYIFVFLFQLLSLYWFLDGFERDRWWELVLSNVALSLALWTHFSGAILMPVFVGYLGLMILARQSGAGYRFSNYLAFGIPFLLVCAAFAWQFLKFRSSMGNLIAGETSPVRILLQVVMYFGPGLVGFGLLAPFVVRGAFRDRRLVFLLVLSFIPVLELIVIAVLNLTIITWYYAFFALLGFAALTALTLVSLAERGRVVLARGALGLVVCSLLPLVLAYHLVFFGDRPRWREAAELMREQANLDIQAPDAPLVLSNVPGIVAYYLDVPPGETMGHPRVKNVGGQPPASPPAREQWYVVEMSSVSPPVAAWLVRECEETARVEARTGPKDRTVTIFHYRPR